MINEEETNENISEYKRLIDGLKTIFTEFENSNKIQEEKKIIKKKSFKKKETKLYQILNNHELYKFLLMSNHFRGKLTLLDEKQAVDEKDSYQKILDLFLEENETISNISNNESFKGDVNKYLLTQLYTAFSLLSRKVYLDGNRKDPSSEVEKSRDFLKHLNSIKFDKDSKLTNQMLEYFNHNILRIEDLYQTNDNRNNKIEINNRINNIDQSDKKNFFIEAHEIKKKIPPIDKNNVNNMNPFNAFNGFNELNNENVILNNDNKEEAVQQVDSISYEKKFRNIDLENEEYKREKSINMRKILELDEDKLKNISIGEFQELISEVYENGTLINKEIEDKITGGKGKLFSNENSDENKESKNSFSIKIANDIEMSINSDEKIIDDEEIIDDKELDFEQEEIKNDENKNSFFEKGEGFSKDFFLRNSEDEDDKINSQQMETISHNDNVSKTNQSKLKLSFSD